MKKYICYLILFLFLILPCNTFAIVRPTSNFYVNDYANILSSETERYILDKSIALNNIDGTQIVVVTVPNLEGNSLEDYANQLFNTWGIGEKNKNNGLLLLLALEEREFRVEVGDGLEGILPDGKTGRFQDQYIIPYLKNNEWNEGIKNGYNAFYSEIVKLNNLDLEYDEAEMNLLEIEESKWEKFFSKYGGIYMPCIVFTPILGILFQHFDTKKRKIATAIYLITWLIAFLIFLYTFRTMILLFPLLINLVLFLGYLTGKGGSSSGGGSYRSSSSRSSGGFSGGGGRSSGGGSSRRF